MSLVRGGFIGDDTTRIRRAWVRANGYLATFPPTCAMWLVVAGLVSTASFLLLLLLLPGRTYTAQNTWDLLIWFDAAHRIVEGQVPNRDFHTPLGLLAYGLLGSGYWLSGSLGGMLPAVTALFTILLLPLLLYSCLSRLPWTLALAFGIHILVLVICPALTGDLLPQPTFGMFYNRFGWALLSVLFLFLLPRKPSFGTQWLDAATMAALWSMMFYLKISYAAIAGVFLLALLAFSHARRAAQGAIFGSGLIIAVVEVWWSGTGTYIQDIRVAGAASGTIQGGIGGLMATFLKNIQGLVLFGAVLLLACIRRVRLDYLLISLFMLGGGFLIANQNYQGPGIPTLVTAALVAVLAPRRDSARNLDLRDAIPGLLLIATLAVPPAVAALANLGVHLSGASKNPSSHPAGVVIDGLVALDAPQPVIGGEPVNARKHRCGRVDPRKGNLDSYVGQQLFTQAEYLAMVQDGAQLLRHDPRPPGKVFTLDMVNPFNALLDRTPSVGGNQWYHAGRTFSQAGYPAPREAFGDADVVMVPKVAVEYATFHELRRIYGQYVRANFELVARSQCWDAYGRKRPQ